MPAPYRLAGRYSEPLLDPFGNGLPGASVAVYAVGTTTPATLYRDATKATTAANPVTSAGVGSTIDALGNLTVFADPGPYDTVTTVGTRVGPTVRIVVPLDPAEAAQVGSDGKLLPAQSNTFVSTAQQLRFVSAAGSDINTGLSPANAFATLQAAHDSLDASAFSGEIVALTDLTDQRLNITKPGTLVRTVGFRKITGQTSAGDLISVAVGVERVALRDMWLQGNNAAGRNIAVLGQNGFIEMTRVWSKNSGGDAIYINNSYWCSLRDVLVGSVSGHGINLDGTYPNACNVTLMENVRHEGEGAGKDSLRVKGAYLVRSVNQDFSGSAARMCDVRLMGVRGFQCVNSSWEGSPMTNANAYPIIIQGDAGSPCDLIDFTASGFPGTQNPDGAFCLMDATIGGGSDITFRQHSMVHLKVGGGPAYLIKLVGGAAGLIVFDNWDFESTPQASFINAGAFGYSFSGTHGNRGHVGGTFNNPNFAGAIDLRSATKLLPPSFTMAGRPAASANDGQVIYVSDAVAGSEIQFSKNSAWRKVSDGSVVA